MNQTKKKSFQKISTQKSHPLILTKTQKSNNTFAFKIPEFGGYQISSAQFEHLPKTYELNSHRSHCSHRSHRAQTTTATKKSQVIGQPANVPAQCINVQG
jgi:hypothetical protein